MTKSVLLEFDVREEKEFLAKHPSPVNLTHKTQVTAVRADIHLSVHATSCQNEESIDAQSQSR